MNYIREKNYRLYKLLLLCFYFILEGCGCYINFKKHLHVHWYAVNYICKKKNVGKFLFLFEKGLKYAFQSA